MRKLKIHIAYAFRAPMLLAISLIFPACVWAAPSSDSPAVERLHYAVYPSQPIPKSLEQVVVEALDLVAAYPPETLRRIELTRDDYQHENFGNYDLIIELTTKREISRELDTLRAQGGFFLSSVGAGTMIVQNQTSGPLIVYFVLDELIMESSWGVSRIAPDALAKLSTAMAREVYGRVLPLRAKLRALSSQSTGNGSAAKKKRGLVLLPEEIEAIEHTASREVAEFAKRVLFSGDERVQGKILQAFVELNSSMRTHFTERAEQASGQNAKSNIVLVDFANRCRVLLSPGAEVDPK